MTDKSNNVVRGWRMKDRYRFRNPDLAAIRYESDCREVFDLHEAICDLIDEERENEIRVSLLTLAQMIHDFPRAGDWETSRIAALEGLRARDLIRFEGDVELTRELVISLPERVYERWHEDGKTKARNDRPKDPKTGKFVPKTPAPTTSTPNGSPMDPQRLPAGPLKDKAKGKGLYVGSGCTTTEDANPPTTTEQAMLDQALAVFAECCNATTDESVWREQITIHRRRHAGAPAERYVDAALQMRAKWQDSKRPFTLSSGWKWFEQAWTDLGRKQYAAEPAAKPEPVLTPPELMAIEREIGRDLTGAEELDLLLGTITPKQFRAQNAGAA